MGGLVQVPQSKT